VKESQRLMIFMSQMKNFQDLKCDVVDVGLCTSCGTCEGICPTDAIKLIGIDPEPVLVGECIDCGYCYMACPGKHIPLPEMEDMLFGRKRDEEKIYDYWLGFYKRCLACRATDGQIREGGASGGTTSAIIIYALEHEIIDAAILSGMDKKQPWRTAPAIATNREEVLECQQSKYAVVPNNAVLRKAIRHGFKKIGVVGMPCHIHGLRKIQYYAKPKNVINKIALMLGLFCAANHDYIGTEHLIKEWCNIERLEDIIKLEYRGGKWPGKFIVKTKDGRICKIRQHDYKYHFLIPFYRRDRCTMCWDYAADLADISLGDGPWLVEPQWNAVLTRTEIGEKLLDNAAKAGYIETKPLKEYLLLTGTQGIESKKHGSSAKYANRIKHGWPVPDYGYRPTGHTKPFKQKIVWSPE